MSWIARRVTAVNGKLLLLVVLAALMTAGGFRLMHSRLGTGEPDAERDVIYTVGPVDMRIRIVQDGELQAVHNLEIKSQVEGRTTIQTLVPEGSSVKKGDVLLTLDASNIAERIEVTQLNLQRANATLVTAQEQKQMQEQQNDADLEAADVALTLARLDLKRYLEGTYPQQLANAKSDAEMAEIKLRMAETSLTQTRSLFNQQFVTSTAVKADQLVVTTARNAVNKSDTALRVLTNYAYQMNLASKTTSVSQAEQRLERTRRINASNLAQRDAEVQNRERVVRIITRRLQRWQAQFEACTIKAPTDGLVVYGSTGNWNSQATIQIGASVWQEQLLFRLPDTSSMKAVVRVRESVLQQLRVGMPARVTVVGIPMVFSATLTKVGILPDSSQRLFNPDLKLFPVELTLDQTLPELKPGMTVAAEICTDELHGALAVPLAAVYSAGADSIVVVANGQQTELRKIRVGRMNETFAELLGDDLKSGEQVVRLATARKSQILPKFRDATPPTVAPEHTPSQTAAGSNAAPENPIKATRGSSG